MPSKRESLAFIVSGPSGSGKSTLVEKVLELPQTMLSVSYTTRRPRPRESPGKWYNFVSEEEFQQMISQGRFLEYAQVYGKSWYGTPWENWHEARENGVDLILEIDVQGAQQLQDGRLPPEVLSSIFVLPPSPKELERRLRARGMDSEEEIERRLNQARIEILAFRDCYDYGVVNDDLERAGREIQSIVLKERRKTLEERKRERIGFGAVVAAKRRRAEASIQIQGILDSFGG